MSLAEKLKQEKRILLDGLDVNWEISRWETITFQIMWRKGASIEEIAEELGRPITEIGFLIIEQAVLGNVKQRRKGLYGK